MPIAASGVQAWPESPDEGANSGKLQVFAGRTDSARFGNRS